MLKHHNISIAINYILPIIQVEAENFTKIIIISQCNVLLHCFFREDLHSAVMAANVDEKQERYTSIKTAAESGWDFSTRWFILNGENKGNMFILLNYLKFSHLFPLYEFLIS